MKVLISAYACEPGKGSEPGVGWNWALAAAHRHETWVLTRSNNRSAIEQALSDRSQPTLRFVYLDLPRWALRWKRGRIAIRLYYVLWQLLAGREARRLQREESFDLVHHLTFANIFLPALACLAGPPFVLGPVGGGQRVPLPLYPSLGVGTASLEILLRAARRLSRLNPLVRIAWRRAAVILVNNEETRQALPARYREKTVLRPNACAPKELLELERPEKTEPVAVYCGRLNRFKGVSLAIRAIALVPDWQLLIVGDGPDEPRLRRVAEREGVADRVRFERWLPQRELWQRLAGTRALLFPSLKEGSPSAAAEAAALGLPVVGFALGGLSALAAISNTEFELVAPGRPSVSVRRLADALRRIEESTGTDRADFGPEAVERDLGAAYERACVQPAVELVGAVS